MTNGANGNHIDVSVFSATKLDVIKDYYEGDILLIGFLKPSNANLSTSNNVTIVKSDGAEVKLCICYGDQTVITPRISPPKIVTFNNTVPNGTTPNDYIVWEWDTEGVRPGMYTIEAFVLDNEAPPIDAPTCVRIERPFTKNQETSKQ